MEITVKSRYLVFPVNTKSGIKTLSFSCKGK